MGIKLAKALGNKVVAITSSPKKEAACREKGADVVVFSTDKESMAANANSCDLILNTVSAVHEMMTYMPLLKKNGGNLC